MLTWDMDDTDMDLWVTGPDGESASYRTPRTKTGGRLSLDCTQGYGPEEFLIKKALPGTYKVEVAYFGNSAQTIAGEVTLLVSVFTKFGTPAEEVKQVTVRLKNAKQRITVVEFKVPK